MGKGVLKHSDESEIGDITFAFSYKDDGRYVYMLGLVTRLRKQGTFLSYVPWFLELIVGNARLVFVVSSYDYPKLVSSCRASAAR